MTLFLVCSVLMVVLGREYLRLMRIPEHLRGRVPHEGGVGSSRPVESWEEQPRTQEAHLPRKAVSHWMHGEEADAKRVLEQANRIAQGHGEWYTLDPRFRGICTRPTPQENARRYSSERGTW